MPPSQDFLTCAFLVTAKDTFLTRAEMCSLVAYMSDATDLVDLVGKAALSQGLMLFTKYLAAWDKANPF